MTVMNRVPLQARVVGLVFCLVLAGVSPAAAQAGGPKWGVIFEVSPSWSSMESIKYILGVDAVEVKGSDLSIGFARGSILGGDWGVSYVRKNLEEHSTIDRESGFYTLQNDVRLDGFEIRKMAVFGNIKDRVQIGLEFGGGAGWAKGLAWREREVFTPGPPPGTQTVTETATAKEALALYDEVQLMPLFRVEFGVGVILTQGFKLRFTTGFDTFGFQPFRVGLVYLFGVR